MPKVQELQLHPLGWENDPEEERFKLSTLDYLSAMTYNNYALFFKLDDEEKGLVPSPIVLSRVHPLWITNGPIQQSCGSAQGGSRADS